MYQREKKQIVKKWLEKNSFFNIEMSQSFFIIADGISNKMLILIETEVSVEIEIIKQKSLQNGRELWEANVIDEEIYWKKL